MTVNVPQVRTTASLDPEMTDLADAVGHALDGVTRLGVAFSGGVDSALLLALAIRRLGTENVVAVLGVSPSLAGDERVAAHEVASSMGALVVEVATHEGDNLAYRANGPDRCFHCKNELFTQIFDTVVAQHALTAVAYGENADDARRPDRPGARAATNHAVLRPLADAGITKADVRRLARALRLPNADKPAAPCLASRIPHFSEVDPAKLAQIELAEQSLRRLGFGESRVRHHGEVARVEMPGVELARAVTPEVRGAIVAAGLAAGFTFVALDLAGVQSGAFTLPLVQVTRSSRLPVADPTRPPSLDVISQLDLDRVARRGYPEAVYCEGKTPEQVRSIAMGIRDAYSGEASPPATLFTRASDEHAKVIRGVLPEASHDRTARLLAWPPLPPVSTGGLVVVICAGTSDLPVAREALLTVTHLGRRAELVVDVGVAGLHRVLGQLELLRSARAIVVVAGMDGALASVAAGLVSVPVVAVPTSVGYGSAFEGLAALLSMLNACAPGVGVVNIDSGYGAGHLAAQIAAPDDGSARPAVQSDESGSADG